MQGSSFLFHSSLTMATRKPTSISLDTGGDESVLLSPRGGSLIADCRGPEGVTGAGADDMVAVAISDEQKAPPLGSHVVPGDRVVIAVSGGIPEREPVLRAIHRSLEMAGMNPSDSTLFDAAPESDADTAYLAADEEGLPCYLARSLVDADVVVAVGGFSWDASLGGRSLEGELWPTFSRLESRQAVTCQLARRGRLALPHWRTEMQQIDWNLGVTANLRLVAGRDGTLAAAVFGLPNGARRAARQAAAAWRPAVAREAAVTIASLSRPLAGQAAASLAGATGFEAAVRAVAAAARVTHEEGTICLVGRLAAEPGVIFSRWRQGAPLQGLVHEAVSTKDPQLIADALQTRLFARALGDRRLVLLTDLDEALVEDLEFGYADSPDDVARLASKTESLIVLHEADRMLPRAE
jgi:hypothetical protein